MDIYLVKSTKWTKHNGYTTWWGPNSSGYASQIKYAGVYTEEEAKRLERVHGKDVCIAVLFDQELVQLGIQQMESEINLEQEDIKRYEAYIVSGRRRIEQKQQFLEAYKEKYVEQ